MGVFEGRGGGHHQISVSINHLIELVTTKLNDKNQLTSYHGTGLNI